MSYTKKVMISTTPELDKQLEDTIQLINSNRLTGDLSKSKIIRIAVSEWIDRQQRAITILKEDQNANKSVEELLKENGYA